MFGSNKQKKGTLSVASCVGENSYSLSVVKDNQQVVFNQYREFNEDSRHTMGKILAEDAERLQLTACECPLILSPNQYQLILMDTPNVPDDEMVQALRWNLKGLSDYDLDDVAMDVFFVPGRHKNDDKKAVAAITLLSELNIKRALFEAAFLDVTRVSTAEMALKNVLPLIQQKTPLTSDAPVIVIGLCDKVYTLHILYQNMFYLIRTLESSANMQVDVPEGSPDMLFELERSIEYCVNKLHLPEPKQLFFTPGFDWVNALFQSIEEKLALKVSTIDLMDYLDMASPLSLEEQALVFYSIVGALHFNQDEKET